MNVVLEVCLPHIYSRYALDYRYIRPLKILEFHSTSRQKHILRNSHEQVGNSWVKVRDQGNKGKPVFGVCCRLLHPGEPAAKAFLLQLQGPVLLGGFNHLNIWTSSSVSCRHSRRLLGCMKNNFPSQVTGLPEGMK